MYREPVTPLNNNSRYKYRVINILLLSQLFTSRMIFHLVVLYLAEESDSNSNSLGTSVARTKPFCRQLAFKIVNLSSHCVQDE